MQTFVRVMCGKTITLEVEESTTLQEVIDMLQGKSGVPPDEQRLLLDVVHPPPRAETSRGRLSTLA